jgi:hypothetical protein
MQLLMRQPTQPRMTVARSNRHKNTGRPWLKHDCLSGNQKKALNAPFFVSSNY